MRRGGLLLTLALVAGLGAAAPAQGAVTIGSNLGSAADQNTGGCNAAPCTTVNLALTADLAPNGLTSPINGVVTSWRFKSGSAGNSVALRVLRPAGGLSFTGAGTSAAVISLNGINGPFGTALPIRAGDHVGLDASTGTLVMSDDVGGTQVYMPPLGDGATTEGTAMVMREVLVQARVEPDVDCDRRGDETQAAPTRQGCMGKVLSGAVSGTTLNLQVQCPLVTQSCDNNQVTLATATPVTLGTGKKKGKKAAASAKKKKKKKPKAAIISLGTAAFSIPAGQTQTVAVPLSKAAQTLFRNRRSVSVNATVTGSGKSLTEPFTATSTPPKKKKKKKKKK